MNGAFQAELGVQGLSGKHDDQGCAPPNLAVRGGKLALALGVALTSVAGNIANVALPSLVEAFGSSFEQVQWVVLSYLLAVTALVVCAGRLGDLFGRRRLLLAGLVIFTGASVLCALAPSQTVLIVGRALEGIGAAIVMTLSVALLCDLTPRNRLGRAMAMIAAIHAGGAALSPIIGGLLLSSVGWRALFHLNVPLAVFAFILALKHLPRDVRCRSDSLSFDFVGTALLVITLSAYCLALTFARSQPVSVTLPLLLGATVGLILFIFSQARAPLPLLDARMLRQRGIATAFITSALASTVLMATLIVGPFYLAGTMHLGAASLGLVMAAGPIVSSLAAPILGRAADSLGAHKTAMAGLAGLFTGASLLAFVPVSWGVVGYIVPVVLLTVGFAQFEIANNAIALHGAEFGTRGIVSGTLKLARHLGLITGTAVMGAQFVFASSASDIASASPAQLTAGLRATFTLAACLVMFAIAIDLRGYPRHGAADAGTLPP